MILTTPPPLYRRQLLAILGSCALAGAAPHAWAAGRRFGWADLQARARKAAGTPYRAPARIAGADAVDFDAAGKLTYSNQPALAGGIRLFPVSRTAAVPVRLHLIENGIAREIPFSRDLFGGGNALGIAGFRAMTASGTSDWMAFLGASYFRASGSQDQYGLSARGVAIDTGTAHEEFPAFTDFWIERTGTTAYTVYAALDGPGLTGAFRIASSMTNVGVVQDVSCVLYPRRDIARLGIAPATSMFWYGEARGGGDWRPEIHDSDGLAMWTGAGERIWRPLANPMAPQMNRFSDSDPRGFGLMQRDRKFESYQDDGAFYDRRPNLWVEPKGAWGPGAVMLYAFPTDSETQDNIVAFWMPDRPVKKGEAQAFDYRLTWTSNDPSVGSAAIVADAWRGVAGRPADAPIPGAEKRVIDFVGDSLADLKRDSGVTADITVARGKLLQSAAYPVVGQARRWRVTMDIAPDQPGPADVRLYLKHEGRALTETILLQVA